MIIITSRARDGFRRAGRAHPAGRTEWPDKAFTAEQAEELKAEPLFTVDFVEDEPKTPAKSVKKDA
ncbi:HI1506-related protein [Falsiroseomonas sp.]|uniref:HI1506-related protein n=1 Tax=Falsiroseomonas sp. TaxID=2870721 RepID=UPI0027265F60|nr:HI1506-related protein [Falsiroseomonas sp.]MDO9501394.1 HI1506-related protein [Falsiroseomonas sp.]